MDTYPKDLAEWGSQLAVAFDHGTENQLPIKLLQSLHADNDRPADFPELQRRFPSDRLDVLTAMFFLERRGLVVSGHHSNEATYFAISEGASRLMHVLERSSEESTT